MRDYLYIPLGGNRKGEGRTLCNLFLTFLIGGLWHGAGWTFILWGSMHGAALIVHRLWSRTWNKTMPALFGWLCTFTFVMLAWIPFRAVNFERLQVFIDALTGQNGWDMGDAFCKAVGQTFLFLQHAKMFIPLILLLSLIVCILFFTKNSQQLMFFSEKKWFSVWIVFLMVVSLFVLLIPSYNSEFIYFQF